MKYRVAFNFWTAKGHYFTEWFETYEEAWDFVQCGRDKVFMIRIEDEDGNTSFGS
jgi:hypothetical protein